MHQVEALKRKQASQHMDPRHQLLLENAFYQVRGAVLEQAKLYTDHVA